MTYKQRAMCADQIVEFGHDKFMTIGCRVIPTDKTHNVYYVK